MGSVISPHPPKSTSIPSGAVRESQAASHTGTSFARRTIIATKQIGITMGRSNVQTTFSKAWKEKRKGAASVPDTRLVAGLEGRESEPESLCASASSTAPPTQSCSPRVPWCPDTVPHFAPSLPRVS
eukprot:1666048-Rhodomonas_salina.3